MKRGSHVISDIKDIHSLEEYLLIGKQNGGPVYLERLFHNRELLSRVFIPQFMDARRAVSDPEGFGKIYVEEKEQRVNDLKQDMQNLAAAIDILRS